MITPVCVKALTLTKQAKIGMRVSCNLFLGSGGDERNERGVDIDSSGGDVRIGRSRSSIYSSANSLTK